MEFCPYCQRWVEPRKDHTDILAGYAFGGFLGALIGAGHYLLKGQRCPICNNIIKGWGARPYVPPQAQFNPQSAYSPYPYMVPRGSYPQTQIGFPTPPSRLCPRCGQPMAWSPSLQQWYCYYCQIPVHA